MQGMGAGCAGRGAVSCVFVFFVSWAPRPGSRSFPLPFCFLGFAAEWEHTVAYLHELLATLGHMYEYFLQTGKKRQAFEKNSRLG